MALAKKIAAILIVGLAPASYLFLRVDRLWAGAWLGFVLLAAIIYSIGRDRGLVAYVFTVASLAFLAYTTVTVGGDGHSLHLDRVRAGVGLVLLAVIVGSVVFLASDFIFAARGGDRWRAFRYLLYWVLGLCGAYREAKDGKATEVKPRWPAFKAKATELITVHADHAVVLERSGAYTRVVGPGQVYTEPGEGIKKVIRTSGQSVKDTLKDVFTKDGIPVTVHFSISFRVAPDPNRKVELGKPYPYSEEAVLKAAYNVGDVEGAMKGVAGSLLRDRIAQSSLDDLYDPLHPETFPLGDIRTELQEQLQNIAKKWGLVTNSFGISRVEVPERVRQQMLERWQAAWVRNEQVEKERTKREEAFIRAERQKIEVEAKIAKAEAEAKAERIREMEKARGKEEIFNGLLTLLEKHGVHVDQHTVAQLLQIVLIGEAEPARLLPYLRTLPASAGFTQEGLVAEAARLGLGVRVVGPSDETTQPRRLRPVTQRQDKGTSSNQDTQEKNG